MGQRTPRQSTNARAWLWNGKAFKPARSLPITDRSCRYGMALFESFPVLNGKPIFLEAHLHRLKTACAQCGFHWDFKAFGEIADMLRPIQFDAFARIYITAGDGTPTSAAIQCRIFLMVEPREFMQGPVVEGYRVGIHSPAHLQVFAGIKTANYWANIHARQLAIERQNHETLLFNIKGELISASMANVFVASKGIVRTPSLACGARDGVLRRWVLDRFEALECSLSLQDVREADEVFLTSSAIGIMPVDRVEGRFLPSRDFSIPLRDEYKTYLSGILRA